MRRYLPLIALVAAAPIAAAPTKPEVTTTTDSELKGWIAGEPKRCMPLALNQNNRITEDGKILYSPAGRRVWVTGPVGPCPSLRPLRTLIVRVWGGQLCRNDQFQVFAPGDIIPSAPCRFTDFTPYTKPKPAK